MSNARRPNCASDPNLNQATLTSGGVGRYLGVMAAVMTPATAELTPTGDEREQVTLLRDDTAFSAVSDPELERWIATARRQADAACVALSLLDGGRQIIRMVGDTARARERVTEILSRISLEDYLLGPGVPYPDATRGAFAEVPVAVTGQVIGHLGMADPLRASWSSDDL